MPSRAERRRPFEQAARVAALALLAVALWRAAGAWRAGDAPGVHAAIDGSLAPTTRDSLAALARAGVRVTWSGELARVAAMAEAVREPAAGWRVSVVSDGSVSLGDSVGVIDSLPTGGGTLTAAAIRGVLSVRDGSTSASAATADVPALGRVLVYGRAGWESKFTIAALEEQGWRVDARLRVGGDVEVTQGAARAPTRTRHAAVVVLDTAVGADAAAITRFVRTGGGLVMAGEGAGARALAALAPSRVTRVEPPETREFAGHEPTHALPLHVLGVLRADAVLLEDREGTPAIAARRIGAGRVVQMGYAETWRWRMQVEERGVVEHRAYWSRLVGTAAAAAVGSGGSASGGSGVPSAVLAAADPHNLDPAPLALALHALGPASDPPPRSAPTGPALPLWLAPLILILLVAEWASRRTRGAP
jgi:hypothetical protein